MLRHLLKSRDLAFLALMAGCVASIGGYLVASVETATEAETRGWRRIDTEAVLRGIERGDLRDREAMWYHPEPGDGK